MSYWQKLSYFGYSGICNRTPYGVFSSAYGNCCGGMCAYIDPVYPFEKKIGKGVFDEGCGTYSASVCKGLSEKNIENELKLWMLIYAPVWYLCKRH